MSKDNGIGSVYPKVVGEELTIDGLKVSEFVPTRHHLLVEVLPAKTRIGGIVIPEAFRERQTLAWVRRINPHDEGGEYEVGDLVLFSPSAGSDIVMEGREMKILQYHSSEEGDILGCWPHGVLDITEL